MQPSAKSKSEKRKATELISFRVRPSEMLALKDAASALNLSVSAFIRRSAFKSADMPACTYEVKQPKIHLQDPARILGELGRIGNNINQMAKACNSGVISASFMDSASIIAELQGIRHLLVGLTNKKGAVNGHDRRHP